MKSLHELQFNNTYSRLPDGFFSRLKPSPLKNTKLVSFNRAAAGLIDLDPNGAHNPGFTQYMSGQELLADMDPLAMVYAGHQFGHYVPQLGDGRAILLGEVKNSTGECWDLQLKGAGITPYSRDGDGRAVLRSTIREYLCSEAMHSLGIATTRALCIFSSDEPVYREQIENGALLVRMAQSHVRFGTFEYFYYNNQFEHIKQLADYVIQEHFAHLTEQENKYALMLQEVISRTAQLIAQWQSVGFSHGVINTDNMSVLGLTIDYGPYGFMEAYDPKYICNHSDYHGRYAYDQQPTIGLFNLSCFAQTLLPILADDPDEATAVAKSLLNGYEPQLIKDYSVLSRVKLGLVEPMKGDEELHGALLAMLARNRVDYTRAFRALCEFKTNNSAGNDKLRNMFLDRDEFDRWARLYRQRLLTEGNKDEERTARMQLSNPKYILRNYMTETAIRKATEDQDYSEIDTLLNLLSKPYDEQPNMEHYSAEPPDWARHIEVSCSS